MRGFMFAGTACLALAACGPEATPPPAEDQARLTPFDQIVEDEEPPPVDCTQIGAVFAAFNEPVAFASLRTGPPISPANAACTVGQTAGPGPDAPTVHALNCTVFSSGGLDREREAASAKAAFVEARRQMDACLPANWTMRDGAVPETDANEAMIYESLEDARRAMTGSFYTYPVQLKKAWVADGATPGWRVTLDFQKEVGRQ
jgi:hypothetical protein